MKQLVWIGALIAVIAIAVAMARSLLGSKGGAWPYKLKGDLLTENERAVFERLRDALPQHQVFAQVALSSVLKVTTGGRAAIPWRNRIKEKSLDFVICDGAMKVIAAVELDDGSHDSEVQRRRDDVKDKACAAAGLKLLRWRRKTVPTPAGIRQAMLGSELSGDEQALAGEAGPGGVEAGSTRSTREVGAPAANRRRSSAVRPDTGAVKDRVAD